MRERKNKGGKEKLRTKIAIAMALAAVVLVSAIFLPIAQAKPVFFDEQARKLQRARWLKNSMEQEFWKYLQRFGRQVWSFDDNKAALLFSDFLKENPKYQKMLEEYDMLVHERKPRRMPDFSGLRIEPGKILKRFDATINDANYTIEIREAFYQNGSERVEVYKATLYGPEIIDPWIYVHIDYLSFNILWWKITYGEDQWYYVHYTTNAQGINEAALFKARVEEWAIGTTALSGILSIIAVYATGPIGAIVGVVGTYNAAWIKHTVDNGYDPSRGIQICLFNRYLYTQIGSAIAMWVYWWSDQQWHRAMPPYGLEWAYFGVSAFTAWAISSMIHEKGDKYGYDRWVWIGVYK